jgi:hypothetical protein
VIWEDKNSLYTKSVESLCGFYRVESEVADYDFLTKPNTFGPCVQPLIVDPFANIQSFLGSPNLITADSTLGSSYAAPLVARYLGQIYETLGAAPSTSIVPASGQYLQEIEAAGSALMILEGRFLLTSRHCRFPEPDLTASHDLPSSAENVETAAAEGMRRDLRISYWIEQRPLQSAWHRAFGKIAGIYSSHLTANASPVVAHRPRFYFQVLIQRLRRFLRKKARTIRRSFFRSEPRFCGLAWSARPWCLLHGARPPRLAALPA